jgi:hypothetical protein
MRRFSIGKGIIEHATDPILDNSRRIDRHRVPQHEWKQSHIIQAMQMVSMLMRKYHGMHQSNPLTKQLHSEVGWGVDQ